MERATSYPHAFETISKTGDIIKTLTHPGKTLTVGNLKYLSGMKKDLSVYFVYKLMTVITSLLHLHFAVAFLHNPIILIVYLT